MQNGENGPVVNGIQELVRMPGGRKQAGFGFAVPHDARHDQIRIAEGCAIGTSAGPPCPGPAMQIMS